MAFPDVTTVFDDGIRSSYPVQIDQGGGLGANWDSATILVGVPHILVDSAGSIRDLSSGAECVAATAIGPDVCWTFTFPSALTLAGSVYFAAWPRIRSQPANGGNTFPANGAFGVALIGGLGTTNQWNFRIYNGGGGSAISSDVTQAIGAGDSVGIRVASDVHEFWYKPAAGAWTLLLSVTDTFFTGLTGRLGLEITGVVMSNISGGAITGGTTFFQPLSAASPVLASKQGAVARTWASSTVAGATRRLAASRTVSTTTVASATKTAIGAHLRSFQAATAVIAAKSVSPSAKRSAATSALATVNRSSARRLAASLAPLAGTSTLKAKLATLAATSGVVAAIARSVAASRRGSSSPSATRATVASVTRSASSATSASQSSSRGTILLNLVAGASVTVAIRRLVSAIRAGTLAPNASSRRAAAVSRSAVSVTLGSFGRGTQRALRAATSSVVALVRLLIPPDTGTYPARVSVVNEPASLLSVANDFDVVEVENAPTSTLSVERSPA